MFALEIFRGTPIPVWGVR